MRRAGALAKGGSKAAKKGASKPPPKPPTRKPPVKKQPVKKGSGGGASPGGDASVAGVAGLAGASPGGDASVAGVAGLAGAAGIASEGSAPSGFSGGGAADGSPIGTSFPSMNINIQVSGQDMAATSGAFGKGAPAAEPAPETDTGEMATATGSKKPKLKKKTKTPAKSKTKPKAKKTGKSKFTLEGSPVGSDSRFEWALIAFLLVAILIVL